MKLHFPTVGSESEYAEETDADLVVTGYDPHKKLGSVVDSALRGTERPVLAV